MGLEPPPHLICEKIMTTYQQLIKTNINFSHFSDNFLHIFPFPDPNFGASWEEMGMNQRCFPFFHITFFHFSHPHIYIAGILGKNGVGPPHFIYIIPIPKSKFWHVLGKKWSWSPTGQISICDSLCVWAQHTPMGYDISIISITISIIYVLNRYNTHALVVGMWVGHL